MQEVHAKRKSCRDALFAVPDSLNVAIGDLCR